MSKPNILSICLLTALLASVAGCQTPPAQPKSSEAPAHTSPPPAAAEAKAPASEAKAPEHEAPAHDQKNAAGTAFSDSDAAAIRDFAKQGGQPGAPRGKVAKLNRGGPYPFGYTWSSLPSDLESRLSTLPTGYSRIVVGSDVGILDVRTRMVVDLMENVFGSAPAAEAKAQAPARKVHASVRKVQKAQPATQGIQASVEKILAPVQKAQPAAQEMQASVEAAPAPAPAEPAADQQAEAKAAFSADDIAAIRDFYKQGNSYGKTIGRVMKPQRGETYPFGYTWRPLPGELDARLSPLPAGFVRVLIGTDVTILDVRTRVVADMLENPAG